jgi:hypothetical protein
MFRQKMMKIMKVLYFVQMDLDGGMNRGGSNKAGAVYGTGYCDAEVTFFF